MNKTFTTSGQCPKTCPCTTPHAPLKGMASGQELFSSLSQTVGVAVWSKVFPKGPASLGDGRYVRAGQNTSVFLQPKIGSWPSFGWAPDSCSSSYGAWLASSVTRQTLRGFTSSPMADGFLSNLVLSNRFELLGSCISISLSCAGPRREETGTSMPKVRKSYAVRKLRHLRQRL